MADEIAKPAAAATPAERTHQVATWILGGACEHDVAQAIEATWPGAKPKPLIVEAMKRIAKSADADPAVVKGWAIEATRSIYQKALDVADHQTALRALKQIVELSGK
jgi:hypothetical protein